MTDQVASSFLRFSHRTYLILVVIAVVSIASGVASIVLLVRDHDRALQTAAAVAQINAERRRNTIDSCEKTNAEHQAILDFVHQSIPPDRLQDPRIADYLKLAARSFPIVTDCQREASERVKGAQ